MCENKIKEISEFHLQVRDRFPDRDPNRKLDYLVESPQTC